MDDALIGPGAPLASGRSLGSRQLAILLFFGRRAPPGRLAVGTWELLVVSWSLTSLLHQQPVRAPLQIWLRAPRHSLLSWCGSASILIAPLVNIIVAIPRPWAGIY